MKEIPLTRGFFALVDDEDFERMNQFNWYPKRAKKNKTWYAIRITSNPKSTVYMHRMIMPSNLQIDHKNRNGLDNQKSNLRAATRTQNLANQAKQSNTKSRFKGVYLGKSSWCAHIQNMNKKIHLGSFKTEEDAAISYNHAALAFFGEFARLNSV